MKQSLAKFTALVLAAALLLPSSLVAQKEEKDKDPKEKKEVRQIIITSKGDKEDKIVVEVVGDNVLVNGKPLEEFKDKNEDINVRVNKLKDLEFLTITRSPKSGTGNYFDSYNMNSEAADHAMLGVTTEKAEAGVKIQDVTKESGAEKAGLKEGDVITKINDKKIEDPDDLSKIIREHKPGDKVTVTYLRDNKEQKATAELTKWKGVRFFDGTTPGQNFKLNLEDFGKDIPRIMTIPRTPGANGQAWNWAGGSPKLGLSVQDTEDGKGVKVIEVDDESNAKKAGIKEEDIITEVDGKAVNSTDEMVKIIKESKEKVSIMIKLQRGGKTQNLEVKMPKKIKTADL